MNFYQRGWIASFLGMAVFACTGAPQSAVSGAGLTSAQRNLALSPKIYDDAYYTRNNDDVAGDPMSSADHWVNFGIGEDRKPSAIYRSREYRLMHHDLRCGFGDNKFAYVEHYVNHGKDEGRAATFSTSSLVFNCQDYFDLNPELRGPLENNCDKAEAHFAEYGIYENLKSSRSFDWEYYLNVHPDLSGTAADAVAHYVRHGYCEGRAGSPTFPATTPRCTPEELIPCTSAPQAAPAPTPTAPPTISCSNIPQTPGTQNWGECAIARRSCSNGTMPENVKIPAYGASREQALQNCFQAARSCVSSCGTGSEVLVIVGPHLSGKTGGDTIASWYTIR